MNVTSGATQGGLCVPDAFGEYWVVPGELIASRSTGMLCLCRHGPFPSCILALGRQLQPCGHGWGRWKDPLKCLREFRGWFIVVYAVVFL